MKLKLIDYQQELKKVRKGTCEMCFSTVTCNNSTFIFQKENGEEVNVRGYYLDWDDYLSVEKIANIIDFADYVSKQEFQEEDGFNFYWIDTLVSEYNSASAKEQTE